MAQPRHSANEWKFKVNPLTASQPPLGKNVYGKKQDIHECTQHECAYAGILPLYFTYSSPTKQQRDNPLFASAAQHFTIRETNTAQPPSACHLLAISNLKLRCSTKVTRVSYKIHTH